MKVRKEHCQSKKKRMKHLKFFLNVHKIEYTQNQ